MISNIRDDEIRLGGPLSCDSIVDGDGLRAVLFTQGCRRHCLGCHNPETWSESGGMVVKLDEIKKRLRKYRGQAGLTFSGGEPMLQADKCLEIARWARREMGWNIWAFSGFLYDDIRAGRDGATPEMWELVRELDVLVDGPFVLAKRDLSVKFRGSSNQRLLRLEDGEIVGIE